jgi:hypothetical protein
VRVYHGEEGLIDAQHADRVAGAPFRVGRWLDHRLMATAQARSGPGSPRLDRQRLRARLDHQRSSSTLKSAVT